VSEVVILCPERMGLEMSFRKTNRKVATRKVKKDNVYRPYITTN
jgi:hypothetical protein